MGDGLKRAFAAAKATRSKEPTCPVCYGTNAKPKRIDFGGRKPMCWHSFHDYKRVATPTGGE